MNFLWNISLDTFLGIMSVAISIGGFITIFLKQERKREVALVVVLTVLVAISVILFIRDGQHEKQVEIVSNEIVDKIGTTSKTFDQLFEELYYPDFTVLSEALDNLIKNGKVEHKILEVRNDIGELYRVRGFYLKTTQ
jgi:uncharacterized membrane protein (UPF0182 family)